MAIKAELVCRLRGRPYDQSRSRTLHGEAHEREADRGESKPSFPHIAARHDHEFDRGGGGTDVGRNQRPVLAPFRTWQESTTNRPSKGSFCWAASEPGRAGPQTIHP